MKQHKKLAWLLIGLLFLTLISILSYKAFRIYTIAERTARDVQQIRQFSPSSLTDPVALGDAANALTALRTDLTLFRAEIAPLFPVTRRLTFLPRFAVEVTHSEQLLDMGIALLQAGSSSLNTLQRPLTLLNGDQPGSPLELLPEIFAAEDPALEQAAIALQNYESLRDQLPMDQMDPLTQSLFARIDPLLPQAEQALSVYPEVPALLGLSTAEPTLTSFNTVLNNADGATYLLIFQNEDEIRATGGFVTAIGTLTLKDGRPSLGHFTDSPEQDDLSKIYPPPPWWLKKYMRADYLLLRDANWEIDYPQAALSMAQLYGYYDRTPLSGVIALDQMAIVELLRLTGAIQVQGFEHPISADNLIDQLRAAKSVEAQTFGGESGERKAFLEPIALTLMNELMSRVNSVDGMKALLASGKNALEEKHILVSLFTPAAAEFVADQGWDGHVAMPAASDALMVVDSNVGFNKTNAVVNRHLSYSVDLSDESAPTAELAVTHTHNSVSEFPCQQWGSQFPQSIREYPMERCYYNYLRVVVPDGAEMLSSHTYPVSGLIIDETIPARVDELDDRIDGGRVYGTLMALAGGESMTQRFAYNLPADVVSVVEELPEFSISDLALGSLLSKPEGIPVDDPSLGYAKCYRLKLYNQPGTLPEKLIVEVRLPNGALFSDANVSPANALVSQVVVDGVVKIELVLDGDIDVEVVYR